MNTYVATRIVRATPMTRGEFLQFRGWPEPPEAIEQEPGYLVEDETEPPNTTRYLGQVSWIPADIFERHYREVPP